jgi:uncharacterized protein YndB with AHSA1/START domain
MTMDKPIDSNWSLDREIVLTRVYDASRELVWRAWTEPARIVQWFGPRGYTCTTHEIDIRVGGRWRFDMTGPNGQRWPNRMVFLEIDAPKKIVIDHGSDIDDDPARFRVTVTFDEQSNGKTVLTLRQLHPTSALRAQKIGFGAVELGLQTLDKLAEHIDSLG